MPINKEKKKLYPADWKQISAKIRERAKNICEFCGAENYKPHPITGSKVVLTVAHLDHTPQNCSDENLKALCQKCHLTYDAKHHAVNARKTRDNRLGIIRFPIAQQPLHAIETAHSGKRCVKKRITHETPA
jgi:5-methylcytosine-specific restriction endonuclease McrA